MTYLPGQGAVLKAHRTDDITPVVIDVGAVGPPR